MTIPARRPVTETEAEILSAIQSIAIAAQETSGDNVRRAMIRWAGRQGFGPDVRIALGNLVLAVVNSDQREIDRAVRGVSGPAKGFEDRAPITVPEWAHSLLPENRS